MAGIFVTASGTDIGKTFVMTMLIRQLRAAGHRPQVSKPVVSGFDPADAGSSDTGRLLAALGVPLSDAAIAGVSPWRFRAPLAPNMAAQRERRNIDYCDILQHCRSQCANGTTLIEGVGGVMAPIDDRHTVLDLIRDLATPVLLIVGSYLGSISHTLTAAAALDSIGAELAGIVVNQSSMEPVGTAETVAVLNRFLPDTRIVMLEKKTARDGLLVPDLMQLIAPYLKSE